MVTLSNGNILKILLLNNMKKIEKIVIAIFLVTFGVVGRLLPHAWNFTPLAAIAIFSGIYLGRRWAVSLPIITMLIGDIFIGFYSVPLMVAVYGSLVLAGLIGVAIRKFRTIETVIATSIMSSTFFFLTTNFAVWQYSVWYEKSFSGLINCYMMALPFFRNTLAGDLFYVAILVGSYEALKIRQYKKKYCLST